MMELRKGEIEFNIENISLELRRPRTFSQKKSLKSMKTLKTFIPAEPLELVRSGLHGESRSRSQTVLAYFD